MNVDGQGASRLRESITRERRAVDITHIGSQCELLLKIPGKLLVSTFDQNRSALSLVFVNGIAVFTRDNADILLIDEGYTGRRSRSNRLR